MRYTARALTHASRPVVLAIGRASGTWWHRWWSRWFVQHFRTWTAKPVSAPQMLALQAAAGDPVEVLLETARVLRAVLPRRWWHAVTGDPVRLILRLPDDVRRRVLSALFSLPKATEAADDPLEQVRRAQRAQVYGTEEQAGPRPSLAIATLTVRSAFGDDWYYAPGRWATADGYPPFGVVWVEYVGLQALEAKQRLTLADGTALAQAKDGPRVRRQLLRLAFPAEVC